MENSWATRKNRSLPCNSALFLIIIAIATVESGTEIGIVAQATPSRNHLFLSLSCDGLSQAPGPLKSPSLEGVVSLLMGCDFRVRDGCQ